ncbi:uncharacterized protein LOC116842980 isoform X2 [Odontomachus brunneus]|uniref:uncharacterized protein LOC116842980 isoform X2 n=1 Tax=Odontomachus brunneus TaxID=486640 RepID=UPI0013F270E4|nr:uncharacterized protein LOC116842980 isoform X2 [Odontomachus brunneus]
MDCCNYVEAYSTGGHFYQQQQQQQQQYFCYDNGNAVYAGYDAAPISNTIEINARYNGAIPTAYPTDYVYNPKEARLRKAMREQNREQSRERSRRSILQSAIAIANARTAAIGGPPAVSASLAGGFLSQHHRTFDCVPATVPSVPMGPGVGPSHRATEAWFQAAHRPKPVHSPRIGDWYGSVDGDPIERLQAMGTMHQQQQQQQRSLDKTSIKEQRGQAAECAAAFSPNGHSPDFIAAEREIRRRESAAEYADFVDGQKWHPYQNSASPHPHPRTPHPSPQMAGILHPNVQNTNAHGHTHGPWGQFCHDVSAMTRNAAIRGPRHAVFLRDRPASRHCAFTDDASRMGYAPSKLNIESIRASYPPAEHQMPRLLESAVDSIIDSTTTMNRREEDGGTRWEPGTVTTEMSLDELVPISMESALSREKECQSWRSDEHFEPKKKPVVKQPLPGFHQAFGSTEIGKSFSRSEFFVNMVGENGGGGGAGGGPGGGGDIGEVGSGDVSRERPPLLDTTGNAATAVAATVVASAATAARAATTVTVATGNDAAAVAATTSAGRTFDPEDQATFTVGDGVVGASYCRQPATVPRWHSPHVGAIGSEI